MADAWSLRRCTSPHRYPFFVSSMVRTMSSGLTGLPAMRTRRVLLIPLVRQDCVPRTPETVALRQVERVLSSAHDAVRDAIASAEYVILMFRAEQMSSEIVTMHHYLRHIEHEVLRLRHTVRVRDAAVSRLRTVARASPGTSSSANTSKWVCRCCFRDIDAAEGSCAVCSTCPEHKFCTSCIGAYCSMLRKSPCNDPTPTLPCCAADTLYGCQGTLDVHICNKVAAGRALLEDYHWQRCVHAVLRHLHDSAVQVPANVEHKLSLMRSDGTFRGYKCGNCGYEPLWHTNCDDLTTHHGERVDTGDVITNACPQCGNRPESTDELLYVT